MDPKMLRNNLNRYTYKIINTSTAIKIANLLLNKYSIKIEQYSQLMRICLTLSCSFQLFFNIIENLMLVLLIKRLIQGRGFCKDHLIAAFIKIALIVLIYLLSLFTASGTLLRRLVTISLTTRLMIPSKCIQTAEILIISASLMCLTLKLKLHKATNTIFT